MIGQNRPAVHPFPPPSPPHSFCRPKQSASRPPLLPNLHHTRHCCCYPPKSGRNLPPPRATADIGEIGQLFISPPPASHSWYRPTSASSSSPRPPTTHAAAVGPPKSVSSPPPPPYTTQLLSTKKNGQQFNFPHGLKVSSTKKIVQQFIPPLNQAAVIDQPAFRPPPPAPSPHTPLL